ncbi:MAG: MFS transporter [Acidimicrobiales bacterium]
MTRIKSFQNRCIKWETAMVRSPGSYTKELIFLTLVRLLMNVALRFVYTFLGPIARGLSVSERTLGQSTVLLSLSGLVAPAAGRAGDRRGRHRMMSIGVIVCGLGTLIAGSTSSLLVFALGLGFVGMGVVILGTSMTAWVGDAVSYERRGFAIGFTELSWAAALFIGMPLVAIAMNVWSWRAPFFIITIATVPLAARIWLSHDKDTAHEQPEAEKFQLTHQAVLLFSAMAIISVGHQLVIVTHGLWLEQNLGLDVGGLGAVAIPLGIGELIGAASTLVLADRMGKAKAAIAGLLLATPLATLIGPFGDTRLSAILLLAAFLMAFEFGFVSAIPLFTELSSGARGTALGIVVMSITVSRAFATIGGAALFDRFGMTWIGLSAALTMITGVVLIWRAGDPGVTRLASQDMGTVLDQATDRGQRE